MPYRIGINVGFVTNSSSMVYHFPKVLLENANVQAFLKAFEIEDGFVGEDLWSRSHCHSLALTEEKKELINKRLIDHGFDWETRTPSVDVKDKSTFVVVIGDEHMEIANVLVDMLRRLAENELGVHIYGDEYN